MVAERAVKICHAHSAQTPHKHCKYSVLSEKNGPRIGSVIHEHYLERDNYLHMALEGPKRRKGRRKLCWKAWVVFKICAWLANYFLLSGPSNRRGTCSRPAHRLLHKTKSDHSGCSYASQNKDHSTTLAIMEIHENIINTLVKGSYIAGLYLDLSKAFDTVDHEILVSKLEHYGIRGPPLKWFHSYLKNRTQYTLANGTKSDVRNINYGVPQGSVLGPLLFLLYTNDMPNCLPESHKTRLFADDSNIFITSQSPYTLKNELKTAIGRILRWLEDNKLTVNLNKTQYSIFQTKNMNIPDWLNNIKINNNTIKRVHSARFLGIILDEKLKWDDHVKQLSESLSQIINAFKIIKNYVPEDKKRMLYYAYIYSRIQYGIEMYGTASKKLIKKVQTKQNRAIKVLHNKNFYTPTTQLHKELRYPLVKDIEKINVCKFVHKQRNNKTPKIFNDLFTENKDKHKYNTRQSQNLATPLAATNFSQKTIDFRGPRTWNSIPMKIRKLECNKHFGKKLRAHLIDKLT